MLYFQVLQVEIGIQMWDTGFQRGTPSSETSYPWILIKKLNFNPYTLFTMDWHETRSEWEHGLHKQSQTAWHGIESDGIRKALHKHMVNQVL